MARYGREELARRLCELLQGTLDQTGAVDFQSARGAVVVAAAPDEIPAAVRRLRPLPGYRWLAIHREDLFVASRATVQTKIGILDESGALLKAADIKLG